MSSYKKVCEFVSEISAETPDYQKCDEIAAEIIDAKLKERRAVEYEKIKDENES